MSAWPTWLTWVGLALAEPADSELAERMERMEQQIAEQQAELARLRARDREGSAVSYGGEVRVPAGAKVDDAVGMGHDVLVEGEVAGDAVSVGGDVIVASGGHVRGDVVSVGGSVVVHEGGRIDGDRVALTMDSPPLPDVGALDRHAAGSLVMGSPTETLRWLYQRFVWMLGIAGASVVTLGLFPQRVARVARDLEQRPVRSGVVGAFATASLVLFSILFVAITVGIGSPVSLAVLAMLGMAWLLGFVAFCQAVGDRLPIRSKPHARWLSLLVGVMVLGFAGMLPWVGWIALATISAIGIGSALATRFGGAR